MTNRVLNPALVLIEVVLNAYVLWVNRARGPRDLAACLSDHRRPRTRRHRGDPDCDVGQP